MFRRGNEVALGLGLGVVGYGLLELAAHYFPSLTSTHRSLTPEEMASMPHLVHSWKEVVGTPEMRAEARKDRSPPPSS